jgi:hypothetical protein
MKEIKKVQQDKHEQLNEIHLQMVELQHDGDTEAAHSDADDLLVEALEVLAGKEYIEPLIEAYNKVDKWYS